MNMMSNPMSNMNMMSNQNMMNMNMSNQMMMNMNMNMNNPMNNMNMMSNPMNNMNMMSIQMNNMNMVSNPMNNMNMSNQIMIQQFMNIMQNNNSVNCDDCVEYNQKVECFSGENAMYCNTCKNQLPSSYQTFLYTTPEILIIVLNRGKGIEFNVKLEFTETLNLYNYVEKKETGYMYKLIGVVTHMGESGASGHFIACCKSPINGRWYKYNDDLVSEVMNVKQEIIDFDMPYILFLKK